MKNESDAWLALTRMRPRRFLLRSPIRAGLLSKTKGADEATVVRHFARASVMVRASFGHMTPEDRGAFPSNLRECLTRIDRGELSPTDYEKNGIAVLEDFARTSRPDRSYLLMATIVIVPGPGTCRVWRVGSGGVLAGTLRSLHAVGRDTRFSALRREGLMLEPFPSPEGIAAHRVGSIFWVGTRDGYAHDDVSLVGDEHEVCMALDSATMPYDAEREQSLNRVFLGPSGWTDGLPGVAVAVVASDVGTPTVPEGWEMVEVPLGDDIATGEE